MKRDPRTITLTDQRHFIAEIAESYTKERVGSIDTIRTELATVLDLVPNDPVLEVGAGGGIVLELLRLAGRRAWGIEVVGEMIEEAKIREVEGMIHADGSVLPFASDSFGLITLWGNTLGPIPERDNRIALLGECQRVLQQKGWMAMSALNLFAGPRRMLRRHEFSFRFQLKPGQWSSLSGYNRYYTRGQLKRELRDAGFKRFRFVSRFNSYMHILLAGK